MVEYAPNVNDYKGNFNPNLSVSNRIREIEQSGDYSLAAGMLQYKGRYFREFKVGDRYRVFGNWYSGKFYVFMIGFHKDKIYEGITYDKKFQFPASFVGVQSISEEELDSSSYQTIIECWGMNKSSSPFPVFTSD